MVRLFREGAIAGCVALIIALGPAAAAEIKVDTSGEIQIITVMGDLDTFDGEKFANTVSDIERAVVLFSSNGGSVVAGLRIGKIIRLRNFATVVPDGVRCASSCALAWLGGTRRFMGADAEIGFHAAYTLEGGTMAESGVGNALVGSYLSSLGLPDAAVIYVTAAHPSEIQWLTLDDARHIGITVALLPPLPKVQPGASTGGPPTQYPVRPPPIIRSVTLEQRARQFLEDYFGRWSESNTTAMTHIEVVYAEHVDFNGVTISRQAIVDIKRKFIERWPDRLYTVRPSSVNITCNQNDASCAITSLVDWDCRSTGRDERAAGLAKFSLQVSFSLSGPPQIASESGSVLPRSAANVRPAEVVSQPSQSTSPAFVEGLRDRRDWESWFASTSGEYRRGAYYWSGQRSLPHPGSCAALVGEGRDGCFAASKKLSGYEARRRADPEYKAGWNSY